MFIRKNLICFSLVGLGVLPGLVAAQDDAPKTELPDVGAIIEGMINATGGEERLSKLTKQYIEMTISLPAMGLAITNKTFMQDGDMYVESENPAIGKSKQGKKGDVIWSMDPMMGPRLVEGAERGQFERMATISPVLTMRENYTEKKCLAVEDVDGKACYKLAMTPKEGGKPETWFVEKASYRLIKLQAVTQSPMGEMPNTVKISDYREVAGITVPFKMNVDMGMQQVEISLDKFETEFEAPAGIFELPEEIKKLVAKKRPTDPKAGAGKMEPGKGEPTSKPKTEKVGG